MPTEKAKKLEGELFISYSRKDKKDADWIARQLTAGGFRVWIDRHDIPGGEEWSNSISTAITRAEAFILVLSPNSVKSREVIKELDEAIQVQCRIIPLVLRPIEMTELLSKKLQHIQQITFYRRRQKSIVDLINSLGGLRGVAAIMPDKSTVAVRENAQLIVELLRLGQEVSFEGARLIIFGGKDWLYYIQFLVTRDDPQIIAEAVGNKNLEPNEQLTKEKIDSLLQLGWNKPSKTSFGNYWIDWQVHTNRDRATMAQLVMKTFLTIYDHHQGENIIIETIDLS